MKLKTVIKVAGAGVLGLVGVGVLWLAFQPVPDPVPPLAGANGYTNIFRAAQHIKQSLPEQVDESLADEELNQLINENKEVLEQARAGLSMPCQVAVEYTEDYVLQHAGYLAAFKRLVRLLLAEGLLAERQHQVPAAVRSYLDILRLSQVASHGGNAMDKLVGLAIDNIACGKLAGVAGKMKVAEAKAAIQALADFEAREDPLEMVMRQEQVFARRTYGLRGRIAALFTFQQLRTMEQNIRQKSESRKKVRRQLMVDLAARAFELEKGAPPKALPELAPHYLKTIPDGTVLRQNGRLPH
jgi:hypothetical protein